MFEELIEPLTIYSGKKKYKIPSINEEEVSVIYGKEILNKIFELKNSFFKSSAWKLYEEKTNFDLNLVDKKVKEDFLSRYPKCCDEVLDILTWMYTYEVWKDGVIS